jgi:hypothetical protein
MTSFTIPDNYEYPPAGVNANTKAFNECEAKITNQICNNKAWYTGELFKMVLFTPDGKVFAPEGIGSTHDSPPLNGSWSISPIPVIVNRCKTHAVEVKLNDETFYLYSTITSDAIFLQEVDSYVKEYYSHPNNTIPDQMEVRTDGITPSHSFSQYINETDPETWFQSRRRFEAFNAWRES